MSKELQLIPEFNKRIKNNNKIINRWISPISDSALGFRAGSVIAHHPRYCSREHPAPVGEGDRSREAEIFTHSLPLPAHQAEDPPNTASSSLEWDEPHPMFDGCHIALEQVQ